MAENIDGYNIRKWFNFSEETLSNESGVAADGEGIWKYAIAAVIANPYAGGFSEELGRLIDPSPELGREFGRRLIDMAAGRKIESYGKACVVGVDGDDVRWVFLTAKGRALRAALERVGLDATFTQAGVPAAVVVRVEPAHGLVHELDRRLQLQPAQRRVELGARHEPRARRVKGVEGLPWREAARAQTTP